MVDVMRGDFADNRERTNHRFFEPADDDHLEAR